MAKPSERKVKRAPEIVLPVSSNYTRLKNFFMICCAKKVLSAVRYLTPLQVKYIDLSGQQTGNIFPISV